MWHRVTTANGDVYYAHVDGCDEVPDINGCYLKRTLSLDDMVHIKIW